MTIFIHTVRVTIHKKKVHFKHRKILNKVVEETKTALH